MMRKIFPIVFLAILLAFSAGAGSAGAALLYGPTPYQSFNDSPFYSTFTGSNFKYYLETFEGGTLGTPGVTAPYGGVATPGTYTDSVENPTFVTGVGNRGSSWFSLWNNEAPNEPGVNKFVFSFDGQGLGMLPTHAGLVWTDVGYDLNSTYADYMLGEGSVGDLLAIGTGQVRFRAYDASGNQILTTIEVNNLGNGSNGGADKEEDRFFGAYNEGGISRIEIEMLNSLDWEIDHLQYGAPVATPEPSTLILCGAGLVGLAAFRRFGKR